MAATRVSQSPPDLVVVGIAITTPPDALSSSAHYWRTRPATLRAFCRAEPAIPGFGVDGEAIEVQGPKVPTRC